MRAKILASLLALILAAAPTGLLAQETDPPIAPDPAPVEEAAPTEPAEGLVGEEAPSGEVEPPADSEGAADSEAPQPISSDAFEPGGEGIGTEPSDPLGGVDTGFPLGGVPTGFGHDLSPWGMFLAADWVVKAVMIGLTFAVFLTGVIWLAKSLEITGANARARHALRAVTKSASLDEAIRALDGKRGAAVLLIKAAEEEVRLSYNALDDAGGDGLKERVGSRLSRLVGAAGQRLSRGTGILATIGSTAPFVGLFGTVWGIMNSFIGIAETQTTNLAVVAPGIAEALLATAIGLVAAIPAVVVYNMFARAITAYRRLLGDTSSGIERLISRDLDYRKAPERARQASLRPRAAGTTRGEHEPHRESASLARPDGLDGAPEAEAR